MDVIIYWQKCSCVLSFGIKYILQDASSKIKDKSLTHNIFRIQSDDSILCGFYCITLEYMTARKTLLNYTNLFFPNDYQQNDKIRYKYFKDKHGKKNLSPDVWVKKIDETRNDVLEEIKQWFNEWKAYHQRFKF